MGSISPAMLTRLVNCYKRVIDLFSFIPDDWNVVPKDLVQKIEQFLDFLNAIDFNVAQNYSSIDGIDQNLFVSGRNASLDALDKILRRNERSRNAICSQLSQLVNPDKEVVTVKFEKTLYLLSSTKTVFSELRMALSTDPIIVAIGNKNFELSLEKMTTHGGTKARQNFTFEDVSTLSDEYFETVEEFVGATKPEYISFIKECASRYSDMMHLINRTVAEIDLYKSLGKVALERNYCRPQVVENESAFIDARQMRHPIVETIIRRQYIAHDLVLGCGTSSPQTEIEESGKKSKKGSEKTESANPLARGLVARGDIILLFGPNACGKSTLMRTVGNLAIMAQMGSFVPASSFRFSPVNAIYTRILTKDDIDAGVSSFQTEALELIPILNRCDNRSLVLCDEIAHSTTYIDALSIIAASTMHFSKKQAIAVLTSHHHAVVKIEEVNDLHLLGKISIYHLAMTIGRRGIVYETRFPPGTWTF